MKQYKKPNIELIKFSSENIITASGITTSAIEEAKSSLINSSNISEANIFKFEF